MKSNSLQMKFLPTEPSDQVIFKGSELVGRQSKAPSGFYTNTNLTYEGVVFRDHHGNCTYFDVCYNFVYAFNAEIWADSTFQWGSEITSFTIEKAKA
jgi:hypothetical protein